MLRNVKLLYADNDPEIIEELDRRIKEYEWEVDVAYSTSEIVDLVNRDLDPQERCYDLIVTALTFFEDNSEAFFTGITAAKMIRKVRTDIPIIFLTQYNNSLIREEVRRVDAELMLKPLDTEFFFNRIEALIKWHRDTQLDNRYRHFNRRVVSINTSKNNRRCTDAQIEIPSRLQQVRSEVQSDARGLSDTETKYTVTGG